ncbi:uncharacterized protein BJX67DRAFT_238459 [Aspergillus lucknowensis]|uniref:Uncharacterized protein n=1 Tax=Aspergillus lucknowensis TaxID=176173 RepID=A0ABR4LI15_9EURO
MGDHCSSAGSGNQDVLRDTPRLYLDIIYPIKSIPFRSRPRREVRRHGGGRCVGAGAWRGGQHDSRVCFLSCPPGRTDSTVRMHRPGGSFQLDDSRRAGALFFFAAPAERLEACVGDALRWVSHILCTPLAFQVKGCLVMRWEESDSARSDTCPDEARPKFELPQ